MPEIKPHPAAHVKIVLRKVARRFLRRSSAELEVAQAAIIRQSGMFDVRWYLEHYPDVADTGVDPVMHYVRNGAAESRNPSAWFDTAFYLGQNPDVAATGMNPFRHYVEFGSKEERATRAQHTGRNARTSIRQYEAAPPGLSDAKIIDSSRAFDPAYYLKMNPDVAASGMDPLDHFCKFGHWELRNPSAGFDSTWYWLMYQAASDSEGNPLAHYLVSGRKQAMEIRAAGKLSIEEQQSLAEICRKLLQREGAAARSTVRIGIALTRLSHWADAEKAFRDAATLEWSNLQAHERLARALVKQDKWWQAVESLKRITELDPTRAGWFYRLGEAQEKMHRFAQAADSYRHAIDLEEAHAMWHYRLGFVYEKSGQPQKATQAYAAALKHNKRADVKHFGVGALHQLCGYWPEAAAAYADELERKPFDAELHYKLGMAHDRCYRWSQAESAYRNAISLDPTVAYWHYRYGFVLERQERWLEAAEAYKAAVAFSAKPKPYWYYRCGYVLDQAGRYEQACLAYMEITEKQTLSSKRYVLAVPSAAVAGIAEGAQEPDELRSFGATGLAEATGIKQIKDNAARQVADYLAKFPREDLIHRAIAHDTTNAHSHYQLGKMRERYEEWAGAAAAYADAVARTNQYHSEWYYRMGFALFRGGRFHEACLAFRETWIIQRPYGISQDALAKGTSSLRLATHYAEYVETLSIKDKVIVYESHLGKFASCNPLAVFNYIVAQPEYKDYFHVWVIDDPERVPASMRRMPNIAIVSRHSDLYVRYIASAKYFINNTLLPQYFVRRPEQKCLATWHGTPLKTLGKQQQYKFQEHKRAQRFFLQSTHIISPNLHTTNVLLDSYDLRHIMAGKLAETGYPRVDLTVNASKHRLDEIRQQLGVTGKRPVVLYAPTWRGTLQTVSYEVEKAKSDLAYLAARHDCDIVFRGHHLMEKVFGADEDFGCTVAPAIIDTNELLAVVDVLITDYSSIFFDFLPTGRPVIYYVYDQEDYQRDRGLYFSMDEMPGYKCNDIVALDGALELALQGTVPDRQHYLDSQRKFNNHDDGKATARVVNFLFNDDTSYVVDTGPGTRTSLLIQGGGFKRNGITTSLLNLLKLIDRSVAHITVAISPDSMEFDPECRELFDRVPEDVAVVARHGLMPMTWEERWLRSHYENARYEFNSEQMAIIRHLFDREFRRVFGDSHFDVAISFSGYDSLWGSILNLSHQDFRKIVYMHSDMRDEYVEKFPELMRMFRLYKFADRLVAVCDDSERDNRENLSAWLGVPPEKFTTSENVQDPERIIELSRDDVEERDKHLFDGSPVFVNMARLSLEKGQAKLIRAFARLRDTNGAVRLLILGSGPLQQSLTELIDKLGLVDSVYLLGMRSNPYPYLRRANCFVLPSNHEAKTMSLMENIIIGTPFVATDISGNHDIKKDYPDYFVDNSEDGVLLGMQRYLDGKLARPVYDSKKHQDRALGQFYARVIGDKQHPIRRTASSQAISLADG